MTTKAVTDTPYLFSEKMIEVLGPFLHNFPNYIRFMPNICKKGAFDLNDYSIDKNDTNLIDKTYTVFVEYVQNAFVNGQPVGYVFKFTGQCFQTVHYKNCDHYEEQILSSNESSALLEKVGEFFAKITF